MASPLIPLQPFHVHKAHYSPPWADMSIIGVAGSSGSGKTSLAVEIVQSLDLPWVIILSIVCLAL
jgi:uridine kinase